MQMLIPTTKSSSSSKDSSSSSGNDKLGGGVTGAGESTLSRALKSAEDKHQPFAQVTHIKYNTTRVIVQTFSV
jgi:hypothetical protein